jgi:hypothetical protein
VLAPFKIDFAILVFVTPADMARRQSTAVVATAALFLGLKKALFRTPFRNFIECRQRLETLRRCEWAKFFECHNFSRSD